MSRGGFGSFNDGFGARGRFTSTNSSSDVNADVINSDWGAPSNEGTSITATRGGFGSRGGFGLRGRFRNNSTSSNGNTSADPSSCDWGVTRMSKENVNDDGLSSRTAQTTTVRGGFGTSRGFGSFRSGFGIHGQFNSSSNGDTNTDKVDNDNWDNTAGFREHPKNDYWNTPNDENTNVAATRDGFRGRGVFSTSRGFGSRGGFGSTSTNPNIDANIDEASFQSNFQTSKDNYSSLNNRNTLLNENVNSTTTRGGFGSSRGGFSNIGDGISNQESSARGGSRPSCPNNDIFRWSRSF